MLFTSGGGGYGNRQVIPFYDMVLIAQTRVALPVARLWQKYREEAGLVAGHASV
jgi:hypothetical protein